MSPFCCSRRNQGAQAPGGPGVATGPEGWVPGVPGYVGFAKGSVPPCFRTTLGPLQGPRARSLRSLSGGWDLSASSRVAG